MKFGKTLDELKEEVASGKYRLKEDEFLGNDGLPYCKKCKTKRFFVVEDNSFAMFGSCECQQREQKEREEQEQRRKRVEEFNILVLCVRNVKGCFLCLEKRDFLGK